MNKRRRDFIMTTIGATALVLLTGIMTFLPWWAFILPLMALGMFLRWKDYALPFFLIGFLAGFLAWGGMEGYYAMALHDRVLQRIGGLLAMPAWLLIPGAGLIGGLVAGLAMYTGKTLASPERFNNYDQQ